MEDRNTMFMRDVDLEYYAEQKGIQKGIQKGKAENTLTIVTNLQNKNNLTLDEALNLLGISKEKYDEYQSIIAKAKEFNF